MAMDIREQFNTQWHGIEDVVLSEAQRQVKFHGKVDAGHLTEKLNAETSKWKRGVLVQGVFYKTLSEQNTSKALLFAESASRLSFTEPRNNSLPSSWWITALLLALAAVLAVVLNTKTNLNYIEQIFYPTLTFVVLNAIVSPYKNKRRDNSANAIIEDLRHQMEAMRKKLEMNL